MDSSGDMLEWFQNDFITPMIEKSDNLIVFKQRSETVIIHMILTLIQNVISKPNNSLALAQALA